MKAMEKARLLVVDDEPVMGEMLVRMLEGEYAVAVARNGHEALEVAQRELVDLILLDVMMPVLNGYEVCQALKDDPRTSPIPVIFITVHNDTRGEKLGFRFGAADYVSKPFVPQVVKARIRSQLALANQQRHLEQLAKTRGGEIENAERLLIRQLGRITELRGGEGHASETMSLVSYEIARSAGLREDEARCIRTAAPLHDVGKITVPEQILLKCGPLTPEEWEVVRAHCAAGYRIIGEHREGVLLTAALGALYHHERWDGTGYPNGLRGEGIPLVARILAVADAFDALTSERPYKSAMSFDLAVDELRRCAGSQFDPFIVNAFLSALPQIRAAWENRKMIAKSRKAAGTVPCP